MLKRYFTIFTVVIFMIATFPLSFITKVHAYTNSYYFNNLKVGLVSMSASSITITLHGDYTLNGQVYTAGSILNFGVNGTSVTFNGAVQSEINLVPNNSGTLLTVTSGLVSNKYMGSFLIKVYNGKLLLINNIDIENYLKGVVGYEMSDSFPVEALKAQAVAARNYALSRIGYEFAKGYDFDDTINYQVYKGYNDSYTRVNSAVEQTKGQILLYNDKLVETLYSAWHGGISEDSENVWGNYVAYLRSVQDTYENDPWPNGNRVLTNADIQTKLISKGYLSSADTFVKLDLNSITKFASGRISNINIIYKDSTGLEKTKSVTKDNTRTFLSLPSNLYTVTYDSINGSYTFSGRGNGHGLGMSQIGAKNRGTAGQTFDQILKFYYQNSYLQNLSPKASLITLTQSKNTLFTGDKVSFNSTAAGGSGSDYLFKYIVKNDLNTVVTQEYSNISTLDFIPSSSGNYTVEAYVRDRSSVLEYDDKKTACFIVYNNPSINSFIASKTEIAVGEEAVTTADMQGGSGSYLYKYEIVRDGNVLTTRNFSTDKQFVFTPEEAGTYTITVYAKDALSSKDYDDMKQIKIQSYNNPSISFTGSQVSGLIQDTFNYSISETNGSGGAQYKFVVTQNNTIIADSGYLASNTFSFIPTTAGSFQVTGYLRDIVSNRTFDMESTLNLTVYNPQISTVTALGYFYDGKTINFNSTSTGVSPLGFNYKYEIYNGEKLITSSNFTTSSSFNFNQPAAGNYAVKVYGKDGLSSKTYDSMKQFDLTINAKPLVLSTIPLKYGMTSRDVISLQSALVKLGYSITDTSGYFGTSTQNAVVAFQKSKGLTKDGIVGSATCATLNDALIEKAGMKSLNY